mmetsp:Transcript_13954/g.17103  ORF Transcript_13954/g.17103 Transcript_13954/m.17103 type:complete len:168 (+) Transcript_13954:176-679(+)
MQLDGCRLAFLRPHLAVVCLRNGALYVLELHDGGSDCCGAGWVPSPAPSWFCPFYLGTKVRFGDSTLVRYHCTPPKSLLPLQGLPQGTQPVKHVTTPVKKEELKKEDDSTKSKDAPTAAAAKVEIRAQSDQKEAQTNLLQIRHRFRSTRRNGSIGYGTRRTCGCRQR